MNAFTARVVAGHLILVGEPIPLASLVHPLTFWMPQPRTRAQWRTYYGLLDVLADAPEGGRVLFT